MLTYAVHHPISHTRRHRQNYLLLHAILFHYTKCFYENYTVRRITLKSYVIAITLLGKFSIPFPFICANWLYVIASKLKSFIMYNVRCVTVLILILSPWNAMKWQKLWSHASKRNSVLFNFGLFSCCLVCDCLEFSSNSVLIHGYKPITKWINCKCVAIISFCLQCSLQWICEGHISVFAVGWSISHIPYMDRARTDSENMQILWQ